jgi:hypothetical protein
MATVDDRVDRSQQAVESDVLLSPGCGGRLSSARSRVSK